MDHPPAVYPLSTSVNSRHQSKEKKKHHLRTHTHKEKKETSPKNGGKSQWGNKWLINFLSLHKEHESEAAQSNHNTKNEYIPLHSLTKHFPPIIGVIPNT